jgi:hypothetical protein
MRPSDLIPILFYAWLKWSVDDLSFAQVLVFAESGQFEPNSEWGHMISNEYHMILFDENHAPGLRLCIGRKSVEVEAAAD